MNDFKNTNEVIRKFAKYVIQQSRTNLTKKRKNVNKELYNSLSFEQKQIQDIFSLDMFMMDYGKFQDLGVRGADPSKVSKNARFKGQQAPNSPYRFGSGSAKGTWGKFVDNLESWVSSRRIRLRDEKGRFKEGSYRTIANIIARNIYARGIRPSLFFTKPFEKAWSLFPDQLIEAYGKDMDAEFEARIR